jgi:tyrosyl-tRNA synthetase
VSILEELQWRGLIADCTDTAELTKKISAPITLYCGFDPTADSLHVGHLVPLLALRRFQNLGHHPIAVAGGATGSIGDPSGKSAERSLLTKDQIKANVDSVRPQLARLLDFDRQPNPARLVDNADWTAGLSYLDFLRDIGKHFSVNQMVAKESVRARMEDREVGISYTEFSYMLLQAFDFYVLARDHGCELQIGGSDQWGNITAGIDLMRKKLGRQGYGLTLPLITKADGTKFGKTEAGAVWLDPKRTSIYRFYQFWINADDRDVIRYLKYFTFLSREEIEALEKQHVENPGARAAHKALAKAATDLIHGENATQEAVRASEALFKGNLASLSRELLDEIDVPRSSFDPSAAEPYNPLSRPLYEVLAHFGVSGSKGQARKDIESGGIYVNDQRVTDPNLIVSPALFLHGYHLALRKGKKNYHLISGSAPIAGNS